MRAVIAVLLRRPGDGDGPRLRIWCYLLCLLHVNVRVGLCLNCSDRRALLANQVIDGRPIGHMDHDRAAEASRLHAEAGHLLLCGGEALRAS